MNVPNQVCYESDKVVRVEVIRMSGNQGTVRCRYSTQPGRKTSDLKTVQRPTGEINPKTGGPITVAVEEESNVIGVAKGLDVLRQPDGQFLSPEGINLSEDDVADLMQEHHYMEKSGILTFEDGVMSKFIEIELIDNNNAEEDRQFEVRIEQIPSSETGTIAADDESHLVYNTSFGSASKPQQGIQVVESSPLELRGVDNDQQNNGGPQFGDILTTNIIIMDDDNLRRFLDSVAKRQGNKLALFGMEEQGYYNQFLEAMSVYGEENDDGTPGLPSKTDLFMHVLTFGWKITFATIPPAHIYNGWAAFFVALAEIGLLTTFVGDLADIMGCSMGLPTSVTAITFVALGTSLPDTFASMAAAQQNDCADAAVGNVTGSNAVNVFLGLGLPWLIGAVWSAGLNKPYIVPAGAVGFSTIVFVVCAIICIGVLVLRRKWVGGELGGSKAGQWATFSIFVLLWLIYVLMSSFQAFGIIKDPFPELFAGSR